MNSDNNLFEQIDAHVCRNDDFYSNCLNVLRENNKATEHSYNREDDIEFRKLINKAVSAYNSDQEKKSLEFFTLIIERWLLLLVKPSSKDIAVLILNIFPNKKVFSKETQFRLNLIIEIHQISPFSDTQSNLIAAGLLSHHVLSPPSKC